MPKSIKLNYLYLLLNKFLVILVQCISIPFLSRVLGPEKIGIQSFTFSIVYLFIVLATFGIFTLGQREIARCRDKKVDYSNTFWNILFSGYLIITFFLILWLILIFNSITYQCCFYIFTISLIATYLDITWFYIGFEEFNKIFTRNCIIKVLILSLIFIFIKKEDDFFIYILILAISDLFGNLSLWINFKNRINKFSIKKFSPLPYIKNSINYYIPSLALSIYILIDKIMIGLFTKDPILNGYYEQTTAIILVIESLLATLSTVMAPRQAYLFKRRQYTEIKEKILKSFDFSLLFIFPSIVGLIIISDEFVTLFLGEKFKEVAGLLCLISPIAIFICISNILCLLYTTPSGNIFLTNKIVILGIILNIIFNCILIPFLQVKGAIVASVISEFVITVLYIFVSKNYINWRTIALLSYKRLFSCAAMSLVIFNLKPYFSNDLLLSILVQICAGAITYTFTLFILRDTMIIYLSINIIKETQKIFKKLFIKS